MTHFPKSIAAIATVLVTAVGQIASAQGGSAPQPKAPGAVALRHAWAQRKPTEKQPIRARPEQASAHRIRPDLPTTINPIDGAELVQIPGGTYEMGDSDLSENPENAPHKVTISGFRIYRDLVTVKQYRRFCTETGRMLPDPPDDNPNWSQGDRPMVHVTHYDAMEYCKWASRGPVRVSLPTEAQWERAARGPKHFKYPWGNVWDGTKCANSVGPRPAAGSARIGSYPANGYGLHDMAGNVWQWCRDAYDAEFWFRRPSKQRDPVNKGTGSDDWHVMRGGCWTNTEPFNFRSANRIHYLRFYRTYIANGFRCAARLPVAIRRSKSR